MEAQKREILEQSFTIKKLQDRLSVIAEEHHGIVTNKDTFEQTYEEKADRQRIIIESHENSIKESRMKIYELEVNKLTLENKVKDLERELSTAHLMQNSSTVQRRESSTNIEE